MKKILAFDVKGDTSLIDLLGAGLAGYAVQTAQHGHFTSICLLLCDDVLIKIQGIVTTVGPWHEVGSLVFSPLIKTSACPNIILLEPSWHNITSIEKLVLEGEGFSAESGLVVKNGIDEEFIIVCSECPYAVEISAPFFDGDFQPEYEITEYQRDGIFGG